MYAEEYKDCLEYIDAYWSRIIRQPTEEKIHKKIVNTPYELLKNNKLPKHFQISLPNTYFVPNDSKFNYIFYWDSYFMFRGLLGTKRANLMKNQVDNFIYLFERYQIIPNFNAPAGINRSQPPFLSSMILDAYTARLEKPRRHLSDVRKKVYQVRFKGWLEHAFAVAKEEYELVWIDKQRVYNHSVKDIPLARYGDRDIGYAHSSELESGWDMTSRFYNHCDQYLPIDLNVYLYKYEIDFAKMADMLGYAKEKVYWTAKATKRKELINEYLWDEKTGFFYDYNYVAKRRSKFLSLAGFTPLWAGLATAEQAKRMLKLLSKFETAYGLTITAKESLAPKLDLRSIPEPYCDAINDIIKPKQWDYPNIWSPLEYLTVIGLLRYGYEEESRRTMLAAIKAHAAIYRKYNTLAEKIDGETGEPSGTYLYEHQSGFGWTNAAIYRYIHILDEMNSRENIFVKREGKPPYDLAIIH